MWLVEKKFLVENDFFPPSGFPPEWYYSRFQLIHFIHGSQPYDVHIAFFCEMLTIISLCGCHSIAMKKLIDRQTEMNNFSLQKKFAQKKACA